MKHLASWCVRHRVIVVLLWLAALIGTTVISLSVGTAYSNSFTLPNTESTKALALLQASAPAVAGDREQIVFHTTNGAQVTDPQVKATIETMLAKVEHVPHVTTVTSPYGPPGSDQPVATQISKDGRTAFATVTFDKQAQYLSTSLAKHFVATAQSAVGPNLQVAVAGQLAEAADRQSFGGTLLGVILAAIVLYLVFGSGYATVLPLVSALASLGTAIGLIGLLSHVLKMPQFSIELVLLIGLGVGVDYALFIVTRHRQGLVAGDDVPTSIGNAVNTSGRAVLFAGIIVCIALLGMFALGVILPLRAGHRRRHRRGLHHDRRPHPAAGPAGLHRTPGHEPEAETGTGRRRGRGSSAPAPRASGPSGPTSSSAAPSSRPWWPCSSWCWWPCPSSRCGWAPPTRATTRWAPPPARPTTCWPRDSAPGSTAPCCW